MTTTTGWKTEVLPTLVVNTLPSCSSEASGQMEVWCGFLYFWHDILLLNAIAAWRPLAQSKQRRFYAKICSFSFADTIFIISGIESPGGNRKRVTNIRAQHIIRRKMPAPPHASLRPFGNLDPDWKETEMSFSYGHSLTLRWHWAPHLICWF